MIKFSHGMLAFMVLTLTACGSSHRVTYSGHEESTEGVPGFVNGKRVSPHVKLGQSYSVDGEEYTPRYQPDYVEEGMASWYGPGFHGGKTANGEEFDKYEMTAAHRTLPLPSIVKVTMLSTGKSVYVRVNDRGPFSKGRIIDLSKAAAREIGLISQGVAKVRVEYRAKESQRFADLLAEGRDPKTIDLDQEVLTATNAHDGGGTKNRSNVGWWNSLSPIASAQAAENKPSARKPSADVSQETESSAPIATVASNDLTPSSAASPFAVMENEQANAVAEKPAEVSSPAAVEEDASAEADVASVADQASEGEYLQLGAFKDMENAKRMRSRAASAGAATIVEKKSANGVMLHHVVMKGFLNVDGLRETLAKLERLGINAQIVRE